MDGFRVVISIFLFCTCLYLAYDLIVNGFSLIEFVACIGGFLLVHYIWPKRSPEDSGWYEFLEFILDIPYRVVAGFFRGLGRVFGSDKGGTGIDFDL